MVNNDAQKRWNQKNPEKSRRYSAKSTTKRFITKIANTEELEELRSLINERIKSKGDNSN